MALIVFWTNRTRTRVSGSGYLFCRKCLRRTPGQMLLVERVSCLFGLIPFSGGEESSHHLVCQSCLNTFDEDKETDWCFDFGEHVEPKTWDCRRCGEVNTSERFHCKRCGRRI